MLLSLYSFSLLWYAKIEFDMRSVDIAFDMEILSAIESNYSWLRGLRFGNWLDSGSSVLCCVLDR